MDAPLSPAFEALAAEADLRALRPPWAPGLVLVLARWQGAAPILDPRAAGIGQTQAEARRRALGELGESLAICAAAHPAPVPVSAGERILCADARAVPGADGPGSEGCAAGPTPEAARAAALCERAERAALALWWQGRLAIRADAAPDLRRLRFGAGHERITRLFALPLLPGLAIRLAVSADADGARLSMGSAAHPDPARAAGAALREMCQAEFSWLLPPRHPDEAERDHRDQGLRARLPRSCAPAEGDPPADLPDLIARMRAAGLDCGFADLSHPTLGLPAARCVCPDWPLARQVLAPAPPLSPPARGQ